MPVSSLTATIIPITTKTMRKIIFATNNAHKLEEVRAMLDGNVEILSLADIGCHEDIPETAPTLEGNALQKAHFVFDRYGLDEIDNKLLTTIIDKFKGGPVGISTIATAIGEDAGTVEEVYEPFLIQEGFIRRTPRGREVTELAYTHLARPLPTGLYKDAQQQSLF